MLYNDYRPATFSQVIGQDSAVVMRNAIKLNRIAHSYILSGTRGVGKTTIARLFARGINCTNAKTSEDIPCGKCASCREEQHPDIFEIDSGSQGTTAAAQSIVRQMGLLPRYRRRVFIFDEAHALSKQAMSVLLKAVEEPAAKTVVFFLTTEPDRIDAALRSRCMWLRLRNIEHGQLMKLIARVAKKEDIRISLQAINQLASYANGSARDALSVLETVMNFPEIDHELIGALVGYRVDVSEFVDKLLNLQYGDAIREAQTLMTFHPVPIVTASVQARLFEKMRETVELGGKPHLHLKWIQVMRNAKRDATEQFPQLGLELAIAEMMIQNNDVPPKANLLSDWPAFVAWTRSKHFKLAQVLERFEFLRVKRETVVVVRTRLKKLPDEVETLAQKLMREYNRNPQLTMEILYGNQA